MYRNSFEFQFHLISIHFVDILFCILLSTLFIIASILKKNSKIQLNGNSHYKYYTYNTVFKISFALLFAAVYLLIYNGGDTLTYFHGATKLNNLFWLSPSEYFQEMLMTPNRHTLTLHFTPETGYPDGGIYGEPESFFISKVYSILMFITGQNYLTLTVFVGWIISKISWGIYELVLYYKISTEKLAAISVLFIPSVAFWCSGVSKDTVVLLATFYVLYYSFGLMNRTTKNGLSGLLIVLIGFFVLLHTRSFMALTVGAPLALAFSTRIVKKYSDTPFIANAMRLTIFVLTLVAFSLVFVTQKDELISLSDKYINEAQVTQLDFLQNRNYGHKRYDLGITDYSGNGIIRAAPIAIFTAFYRPFIWEARSIQLVISGLETLIFIYLTFYFFIYGKVREKIRMIKKNELLMFSLFFTLILAFFAGFTSILFGVLVRFKAPFLPFFLMILTIKSIKTKKNND